MYLFLDFLSCSFYIFIYLFQYQNCLITTVLQCLDIRYYQFFNFILLYQNFILSILVFYIFPINFQFVLQLLILVCLVSQKFLLEFYWNCVKSLHQFGDNLHFNNIESSNLQMEHLSIYLFTFFQQCFIFLCMQVFNIFCQAQPYVFCMFDTILNRTLKLFICDLVYKNITDLCILSLYDALLQLISISRFLGQISLDFLHNHIICE